MFEKLLSIAKNLNINIKIITGEFTDEHEECPFNYHLAIQWPNTLIIQSNNIPYNYGILGDCIHEMGHLVCTKDTETDESGFFGWEFAVAKMFDAVDDFVAGAGNYAVYTHVDGPKKTSEFGSLTEDEQSEVLEYHLILAEEKGFIVNDEPISFK